MKWRWFSAAGFALVALVLSGCASGPRFKDQPIVWRLNDRQHIAEPEEHPFYPRKYFTEIFVTDRLYRTLEIPDRETAHNINALGEVPDSHRRRRVRARRSSRQRRTASRPSG